MEVAIKKMKTLEGTNIIEQWEREIRTLVKLQSPYIVSLIGISSDEDSIYTITEFMSDGTLFTLLHPTGLHNSNMQTFEQIPGPKEIPPNQMKQLALDIAMGVDYLHENKTVHRDLKSTNILLYSGGTHAKIADFGLAYMKTNSTILQTQCGTFMWMAPEIMLGQSYSEKADVYSFGIILYEIVTKQLPYSEMNQAQIIIEVANQGLRPPFNDDDCSKEWKEIIEKCWSQDPQSRPTMSEVIGMIKQIET